MYHCSYRSVYECYICSIEKDFRSLSRCSRSGPKTDDFRRPVELIWNCSDFRLVWNASDLRRVSNTWRSWQSVNGSWLIRRPPVEIEPKIDFPLFSDFDSAPYGVTFLKDNPSWSSFQKCVNVHAFSNYLYGPLYHAKWMILIVLENLANIALLYL